MLQQNGLYILDTDAIELVYGPQEQAEIAALVNVYAPPQTRASILENPSLLRQADVILSGWGGPLMDEQFLVQAPKLKALFYGGGALSTLLTPAVWERGIVVTSAIVANAIPVAEFTLATILLSLKQTWRLTRQTREQHDYVDRNTAAGCYGSTVGLVSMGVIARRLLKLLTPFDLKVIVYDPFLTAAQTRELGVENVSLDELFRRSDAVSLHTPLLSETERMITGEHLSSMKQGATFINTARGEVVREDELIETARRRTDLQFILDVTDPEPPEEDSPLYILPNVMLTPHMAGSVGKECRRMGRYMVEELKRFVAGKPLDWAVTPEAVLNSSHRPVLHVKKKSAQRPKRTAPLSPTARVG
jgi:phosphoglycerate dehydrogenase-like enzyme